MNHSFKIIYTLILGGLCFTSCADSSKTAATKIADNSAKKTSEALPKKELSQPFKAYWYAGDAEITSYELKQARYGELREGTSVLVYVTEPFLAEKQVKADAHHSDNIPVLKLNFTKNFLTGIYPYSIMTSSFYPVHDNGHALKVTNTVQEWCGHVFAQINNKDKFEINSYSYFESEGDQHLTLDKNILENELWNKIRIDPNDLPTGSLQIIPSLEFLRLRHKELKAYTATANMVTEDTLTTYTLTYPELERSLSITFQSQFPFGIESWSETFVSGFGPKATPMTTTATKLKTIKSPYWQQNANSDEILRESLSL
ncbi:septum formation inhibitor Maf [Arenibacter sp. GZD96]|uniref:hypothetical protein n=1 Tax=Aurantibrevibacter litoralis TaxID=3106030 RepID=UPI002AFDF6DD|nr:hypothetical protein [Arenibacter sp. GZD-96]MEA1786201.1 septum formation inhibitor Maf [Arenibacter sp. GZD-96]